MEMLSIEEKNIEIKHHVGKNRITSYLSIVMKVMRRWNTTIVMGGSFEKGWAMPSGQRDWFLRTDRGWRSDVIMQIFDKIENYKNRNVQIDK